MIVAAHGNVSEFCEKAGMTVYEKYEGDLESYNGSCPVIVTDQQMSKNEFYYLKCKLLRRRVELISVHHCDRELSEFVAYIDMMERREKHGGRLPFGFVKGGVDEKKMAVVRRIFELRDTGHTYKQIQKDPDVHHGDGRELSISTIQVILNNRSKYETD